MAGKIILNIILLSFCLEHASPQEVITGLYSNPLLEKRNSQKHQVRSKGTDTLDLPFFDDFSGNTIVPDSTKWSDEFVFINNTYSNRQLTTGIATFDALNNKGRLYENASSATFEADRLTSHPIDLSFVPQDNIWLSFYYEPGGVADMPEDQDSLSLHFYAPEEGKWYSAWRVAGNDSPGFKPATIRIDNPKFLKKGFRFRFINYASLSPSLNDPSMGSNCDQWNLDYVLLDKNRNQGDTIFRDVAFRYPSRSLLKNHEAMPWKQFQVINVYSQEMGVGIPFYYRNNDTIIRNVTRNFEIWDVYQNISSFASIAGAANTDPLTNIDFKANLAYIFNSTGPDSALFRIKSWLITDNFDPKTNDTVTYYQHFKNYFAFDDGSAEAGYGINGLGSRNAMVAYRFRSYIQDTLRAIQICFNDSYLNSNQRSFDLVVWDNLNGAPGSVIFSQEEVMVEPGASLNGFHTYVLPTSVAVNGIFYVGWKQRSETFINAGIDLNTQHGGKQFYWLNGTWNVSQAKGSLMIRPVTGPPLTTSINDLKYRSMEPLRFRPNPAREYITIDVDNNFYSGNQSVSIIDLQGRELISVQFSERIDISTLREGIYLIMLKENGRPSKYGRLIKIR